MEMEVPPSVMFALPDVTGVRTMLANACLIGERGTSNWVLVDAGVKLFGRRIVEAAEELYHGPPRAILLTHGHFDHVGSLKELAEGWDVPVYAHELELPFLTGREDYLPPDPSVGGGLMASLSFLYPNRGIDLGDRVKALPPDGRVPELPDWQWVHTPGHTDGHVAYFREGDRALVAGDAFLTVKQESALAVITQEKVIHGPPMYFTTNWERARESVLRLRDLRPEVAVTGHGVPMFGRELQSGLDLLAANFDEMAVPEQGRYVPSR